MDRRQGREKLNVIKFHVDAQPIKKNFNQGPDSTWQLMDKSVPFCWVLALSFSL
jgi:hypothetical protein